jgi:hypothetical protein
MRLLDGRVRDLYRSYGVRPVRLAIRASMRGPVSSRSWNGNTTSGQPARARGRCDPDSRLICQPIRSRAARTRRALVADHSAIPYQAAKETLRSSGASSPCSSRSARTRSANACTLAMASGRVAPYVITPGNAGTSATQRPSASRSSSIVSVTVGLRRQVLRVSQM